MASAPAITTCLWFDANAEEAANFYVSIFPNSRITGLSRYGKNQPGPEGQVMVISFELGGKPYMGLNGGPIFKFSEAISQVVNCKDQAEIDHYWDSLLAGGGAPQQCGWLKDRFGLSWQIVPAEIGDLMTQGGQKKADAVMAAVMQMVKLDLARMRDAYNAG
jgi:predicted 3-demethylubiquinone-9 3-methyltransferase (glyoxalase superfamily)